MERQRVHLMIHGYVQGVFFRASTRDTAVRLGLKGWVRNLPGSRVEAVFEGPLDKLQEAVAWCHHGPPGASVSKVDEQWGTSPGESSGFEIRYS